MTSPTGPESPVMLQRLLHTDANRRCALECAVRWYPESTEVDDVTAIAERFLIWLNDEGRYGR